MKNFKLQLKCYFTNPVLSGLTALYFIGSLGYVLYNNSIMQARGQEPLFYLAATLKISLFSLIFFMFVSYEFLNKARQCLFHERLDSMQNGKLKYYADRLLVLTFIVLLQALIFLIINMQNIYKFDLMQSTYPAYVAACIAINLFAVPIVGVLIGSLISFITKRLTALMVIVFFALMLTPFGEMVISRLYTDAGIYVYPILDIFNLAPPSLDFRPIAPFGYSIQSYRIQLILVWALLGLSVMSFLLLRNMRKSRIALSIIFALGCLTSAVLYVQPASKVVMSYDPVKGGAADAWYYRDFEQQTVPADFEITKYDLSFSVQRELSAKAVMVLDKDSLDEYRFTLYHGFSVNRLEDADGRPIAYEQKGDYLYVKPAVDNKTGKISIEYKGHASKFYSNEQGVFLPGYFPFYPHSGFQEVFNTELQGFNRLMQPAPVDFHVSVKSAKPIFCSLPSLTTNEFSGKSTSFTLMSGFLASTRTDAGIEVVYPYLSINEFNEHTINTGVNSAVQKNILDPKKKQVFIIPNTNLLTDYEAFAEFSDHYVLQQFLSLDSVYELQKVNSKKRRLYDILKTYAQGNLEDWAGLAEAYGNLYKIAYDKMQLLGKEKVIKISEIYLADDNDNRSVLEFLNSLT